MRLKKDGDHIFFKFFNEIHEHNIALEVKNTKIIDRIKYVRNIRVGENKDVLRKMKVEKGVGLDGIPIEI